MVLDGVVDMNYRLGGEELVERLAPGRICVVEEHDEHVANPVGAARILVIEQRASA